MADKRISQLTDRGTVANSDVVPIVVSGAVTTNKATISSIQTFMQGNLDMGVTSVGITFGTSGTDINASGSPVTSSGNITINLPTASATNRGALSSADWSTFNSKQPAGNYVTLDTTQTITAQKTFSLAGASDTVIITKGSGAGFALDVIKAGNGETLRVTKTSGSGNAMTVIGGNFEAPTIVKTGGTSSQFLKADGSVDSSTYLTTGTATSTYVPYTGAAANVDLGVYNLTSSAVNVNGSGSNAGVINLESNTIFPLVNGYGTIGSGTTNQFNFYQTTGAGVFRGAILSLNSITASETRTYTLPDASGTVALTTDLGAYLPLTGGTLTGALNGTSAAFTGAVSGSAVTITATTGIAGDFTNNSTTNEALRARNNGSGNIAAFRNASAEVASITNSGGLTLSGALSGTSASFSGNLSINTSNILLGLGNGASNESLIFSYNDNAASRSWRIIKDWTAFGDFQIQQSTTKTGTTYSDILRFTSTGAATFSSSVTAKGTLTIGESLVENGIINSPEGIYINADSDASGGSNDIVFGKGRTSTSGGTTFMTIKNGGNVGIGTASPTDFGSTYKVLSIDGAGGGGVLDLMNTGVRSLTLAVDGGEPSISSRVSGNPIVFRTNNAGTVAERMRITSEGNVGINQPSPTSALEIRSNSSNGWLKLSTTSGNPFISSTNNLAFYTVNTNEVLNLTGDGVAVMITGGGFANQTTLDANTRFQGPNNSATAAKCYAWNTYSDQRIKEDINPLTYGLNELMQLNPVSYNQHDSEVIDGEIVLKETYKPTIGLIAQDVYDLIPESVGVGNDTELWGLDYDKIVPVLIKAIQELKTEIDSLKNQIK